MKGNSARMLAAALIPVGVVILLLVIQDYRQAWPFSQDITTPPTPSTTSPGIGAESASARLTLELPATQVQLLGVQFDAVEVTTLEEPIQAVATVVADEARVVHVHTRVSGWLEELHVNTTGQYVKAGDSLGRVFSQELLSSQQEYLSALQRAENNPASAVLTAARSRLQVLGMSEAAIEELEKTGQARRLVTINAPISGVVLNRGVSQGTAVDPSTEILTLVDLSQVWVIAEVPIDAAGQITVGSAARLRFPNLERETVSARVEFVYPTLTERTRSVRVRMSVPNADGRLRPGMYGEAIFPLAPREAITVARDAIVDTGQAQHVFVHRDGNVFEPRKIKAGVRLPDRVEVLEGLAPGEHVVTGGVFLIDSESRLRASGGAAHAGHSIGESSPARKPPPTDDPPRHEH